MGDPTKTPLCAFGNSGRVPEPQNQYYLSLKTPGYLKEIQKISGIFLEHHIFRNIRDMDFQNFEFVRKDKRRTIPPIRLIKS